MSRDECLPLVALPPHPPPVIKADGQNALWTRQATRVCNTGSSLTLLWTFFLCNHVRLLCEQCELVSDVLNSVYIAKSLGLRWLCVYSFVRLCVSMYVCASLCAYVCVFVPVWVCLCIFSCALELTGLNFERVEPDPPRVWGEGGDGRPNTYVLHLHVMSPLWHKLRYNSHSLHLYDSV